MSTADPSATSYVVRTVVRLLVPFVALFGLFVAFHGAESAGGGFQGGVVVGTSVVLLALVFDIERIRNSLDRPALAVLATSGVVLFVAVGIGGLVLGGAFLQYSAYPFTKATTYGIELVELGIGATVTGVVVLFFFGLASTDSGANGAESSTESKTAEVTERD